MGCEGTMDIDLPIEVGPTEETVEALIEYLVGPLLPLKHSDIASTTSSESQQKSVAKQVHAAAVLYNYYHLNRHKEREFLKFDQFCNLAIMFKPSILQHMKYMCQSERPIVNDPENQLSLAEKAIMDACTISETLLEASAIVSDMIEGWPITKVAVLLVDSNKENCFLHFNSGVWSVIEKDIYSEDSGIGSESIKVKKRKMSLMSKDEAEREDQQLAFSAVKEVAGVVNGELKVLESHVVYSLSRAKTATRFYIVQSTQSISEGDLVPIQDAINSLQGPVVKKTLGSWIITPVVEYYYLLPYADIISEWFSRVSNSLPHQVEKEIRDSQKSCEKESGQIKSKVELESAHISNSNKEPRDSRDSENTDKSNKYCTNLEPVSKVQDDVITSQLIEGPFNEEMVETGNSGGKRKQKDMNGSCIVESNNLSSGANNTEINNPLVFLLKENQNTKMRMPLKVYHHEKRTTPTNAIRIKEELKELKNMPTISELKDEKVDGEKKSFNYEDRTVNHAMVPFQKNESLENFDLTVAAKRSELSEAALGALLKKRQKLCDQQHNIESELTLCEKKIHAILNGGNEDCLDLKLEAIIDCCKEFCQKDDIQARDHTSLYVGRTLPLSGKGLSEAQLTLRKACQELDDICLSNNWMLPTYRTSHSDGGFVVNVTVKGSDFECLNASGMKSTINEARNSAATHAILKLQQMAMDHNNAAVI